MGHKDPQLDARADGVGRRGEVGRRGFVRLGVIGAAMSSAAIMRSDPAAGAAAMTRRLSTVRVAKASGLVKAGPELALPPGFSYHTFGAFGSAMGVVLFLISIAMLTVVWLSVGDLRRSGVVIKGGGEL